MKKLSQILVFAIVLMSVLPGNAQKNSDTEKRISPGTPTGFGLGLRLGDPLGLTLKKYFGGNKAFEFSVGRTYNESAYDRDRFFRYGKWNKKGLFESDYYFSKTNSLAFQLHYLVHNEIRPLPGLRWYWGFGAQLRTTTYYYYFKYSYAQDERYTGLSSGADGVIGLEYSFKNAPFSIFLDANLYLEAVPAPFAIDGHGGIGARFNF